MMRFVLALVVAMLVAGEASAQSLTEERARRRVERTLGDQISFTNSVCHTEIALGVVWGEIEIAGREGAAVSACDAALSAVETVCRSEDRHKIRREIVRYRCELPGAGLNLSGGTFAYGVESGEGDYYAVLQFLRARL